MPSIEEARAALITHLISHYGDEGHPKARCCEPLADAYALAVLEEAYLMYCGYDPEFKVDETAALDYAVIRDRIKELGKEEGE